MYEFLALLQRLPKPLKYLGAVFLFIPMVYVVTGWLGIQKYWWVFVLGILVIAVALSLFNMGVASREKRQGQAFEGELRKDSQKSAASRQEVRQALGDLGAKWTEAMTQLRQARLDIYSLPWYLLIGEPQSGKSTTLKNSGLEFPVGNEALSGAGGTRNCDWWFANEAVILDTAGRFTFQEESAPDQAEWSSFLKLLRKYRKYCPINGVLVVIPCTSLLEDSPEEQERKATNIRQKLLHVQRILEIRFPVFFLITKADRVLGFSEFFLRLDPVDQQQLVGWSNPEGATKPYDPETFGSVYDQIVTRFYKLRLKLLGDEENPHQADKLYVFPEEFRALKTPLANYFKTIFLRTRFDEPFNFRGFYVSSGVQQGRPIAQASRDLLDVPGGAAEGALENLENIFKKSRAFFIRHFYEKKVFPEQGLISRTAAAEAKQRKTLWLARVLGILAILLFLGGMIPAYRSLQKVLKPIRTSVQKAKDCVQKGCSIAEAYEISSTLQKHREEALRSRFLFAFFLRGTRSNELFQTLGKVQRKVYLGYVVQPLLADTEARMAALDWADFTPNYASFFAAFKSMLEWRAITIAPGPDSAPLLKPEDLKLLPILEFERNARGIQGGDQSAEINAWIESLPRNDPNPNRNLEGAVKVGGAIDIAVPDPERPISKFEDFWRVENLARWDYTLMLGLQRYAELYAQMAQVPRAAPAQYLSDVDNIGRLFRTNYEATTKHMATVRPGETSFPGAQLVDWKKYLQENYRQLLHWKPVAPRISEARLTELLSRLEVDDSSLKARRSEYAYLLDTAQPKPAWTKAASTLGGMLVDLTAYADIPAFLETEDGKLVATIQEIPDWGEKTKRIDEWRKRQEAGAGAILAKGLELSTTNPDARFDWSVRRPALDATTQLALLERMLPIASQFFNQSLVTQCPPGNCYQPVFARTMISAASAIVSAASTKTGAAAFEGISTSIRALSDTEATYLRAYIDQMRGRAGSGGGGFIFPSGAAGAGSWPSFQRAIGAWSPQGGGSGAIAPDLAGQLTAADFQQFAAANNYLAPVLAEYNQTIERPRLAAAGATVAPELLEAATTFRTTVTSLSDQPLRAWQMLSRGEGGVSLKQYKAFSENLRLKNNSTAARMNREVEDHGAHLLRDDIKPLFAPKSAEAYGRLRGCCVGEFPLIDERQLQTERGEMASGQGYTRAGSTGASIYRLNLPTLSLTDLTEPLAEFGLVATEFAIDPILRGEADEFDFVGPERPILAVARNWQVFLYGPNPPAGAPPKQHSIEIKSLDRPPLLGDRVSRITFFNRETMLRPSTDAKTGRSTPPFQWRLSTADSPIEIVGQNEDARTGWTGRLEITGGPLKLFYYVLRASEPRQPNADGRVWVIRVEIPDAERPSSRLQGVFELKFDDPLPGVIVR